MRHQFRLILTALMFYTRLPVPSNIDHKPEYLNQATRYFPLVGLVVGGLSAAVFLLLVQVFSPAIALIFSMATSVLVTGAFHEDGFADMCDAFGGGWTVEKKLSIMKDSRIGTYGTVGLIFILSSKFLLLYEMPVEKIAMVLLLGNALSRIIPVWLIYTLPYVQDIDVSKAKPIGHKNKWYELIIANVIALLPLFLFSWQVALVLVSAFAFFLYFRPYLKKQVGGYTGDCLGAAQQLSELVIYLSLLVIWKFLL